MNTLYDKFKRIYDKFYIGVISEEDKEFLEEVEFWLDQEQQLINKEMEALKDMNRDFNLMVKAFEHPYVNSDDGFCAKCGLYFTHPVHKREL